MDFKRVIPYLVGLVILLVVSIGIFPQAMQGKVVNQPDKVQAYGKSVEIDNYFDETGEWSLWTNQLFGGMPTFYGGVLYPSVLLKPIAYEVLMLGLPKPVNYFFLAFLCGFILFLVLDTGPWLAVTGALGVGLCTYNFVIFEAGHDSKLFAVAPFPLVAAGVLMVYQKGRPLLGGALFAFALGSAIMTSHIQMVYYLGIALLIYVIIHFVQEIRSGHLSRFLKASVFLLAGVFLAIGANGSRLISSYKYMKETMRGPAVLVSDVNNTEDSSTGLKKDYVFAWSHGIGESLTFLVPGAFGGATQEKVDRGSAYYKDMKRKGASGTVLKKAPLYWGAMPSTSGPVYFGAIMIFLFILGLMVVKGTMKWWLLTATIVAMLLSFGKNLMWFNDIIYHYFPLYDKFRAVSSTLVILQLTIPLLGILGLAKISSGNVDKELANKSLKIAAFIVGGICLLLILMGGNFFDFAAVGDARYAQAGYNIDAIIADRKSLMQSDAFRSLIFVLISAGLIWAYVNNKIAMLANKSLFISVFSLLVLIDMVGVGKRYIDGSDFISTRQYESNFSERIADKQIKQDKDPNYRVFDLSINTFNSNQASVHHKTVGGYHAAKLRRYQDMVERHIGRGNLSVLNMMNTKYIITQKGEVQQNPGALGHAWFAGEIKEVSSPDEEIAAMDQFDSKTTAIVHNEFSDQIDKAVSLDSTGSIKLIDYKPNHLTYQTQTSKPQLAIMSEVWYNPGPGEGWQAYIDGKEVDHIRANYILRGINVPEGQHTIEFKFYPEYYYQGESVTWIFSLLLILGFLALLGMEFFGWPQKASKD